jgi:nucleoside-diphosphate-sugar epimerase
MIEAANMVLKVIGAKSRIKFEALPQHDPKQRKPDIAKAKQFLGWERKVDLKTGLNLSFDYSNRRCRWNGTAGSNKKF